MKVRGRRRSVTVSVLSMVFVVAGLVVGMTLVQRRQSQSVQTKAAGTCSGLNQPTCQDTPGCSWTPITTVYNCSGSPPCQSASCTTQTAYAGCNSSWIDLQCTSHSGCTFNSVTRSCSGLSETACKSNTFCNPITQACSFVGGTCHTGCAYTPAQTAHCSCTGLTDQYECQFNNCTWFPAKSASCTGSYYNGCSGSWVESTSCTGQYATGQSCTGQYSVTAYGCTGIPLPTNTPATPTSFQGQVCENQYAGRCVGSSSVCSPSTVYSADCPAGQKCVAEAAICVLPTPTPNLAVSLTPTPNITATVAPPPRPTTVITPTPTTTQSFVKALYPIADSFVNKSYPSQNYGSFTTLEVDGSPVKIAFMKFDLYPLTGKVIEGGKLYFNVRGSSISVQNIKYTSESWTESGLTYSNMPALGSLIGTLNGGSSGQWVYVDITGAVKNKIGKILSIAVDSSGFDGFEVYSNNAPTERVFLSVSYH